MTTNPTHSQQWGSPLERLRDLTPWAIQDDRTAAECVTHTCFVKGRDTFTSGWGGAEGGTSYAVWCCRSQDLDAVLECVKARPDMVNVTTNFNPDTYKLKRGDRLHIYVVDEGHPSLAATE